MFVVGTYCHCIIFLRLSYWIGTQLTTRYKQYKPPPKNDRQYRDVCVVNYLIVLLTLINYFI